MITENQLGNRYNRLKEQKMTLEQLKVHNEFRKKINNANDFYSMQLVYRSICSFFRINNIDTLYINLYNTIESYTPQRIEIDKDSLLSFLNGKEADTPSISTVKTILSMVDKGKTCIDTQTNYLSFVREVFHSYNGKIKFDKEIEAAVTQPSRLQYKVTTSCTKEMVSGVITKLEIYAAELLENHKSDVTPPAVQFNNYATAQASANTTISIESSIENALNQINESCLSEDDEAATKEKLEELKQIINEKTSKREKWNKLKNVMKWLAEQSLTVAGIILPLISNAIPQ